MFKKWISTLVCMALIVMLTATIVSAAPADTTVFSLSVTEGGVGDTVTLSISLSENSYFTNATFYLHYDPTVVSYVEDSLDAGAASPKGKTMFDVLDHPDKSYVKGAYVTVSGITKGGELIKMDFEVLKDSPAPFSLSFDECIGVDENDVEFNVKYEVVGCVLNNDGSVSNPTGDPVVTTTTITPVETTTATAQAVSTTTTTMPTMIVTDEGNNKIPVPVVTSTDAAGNVATVPVAVVTNAQGTTVTIPVVVVTDTQGSVATIPVAEGTDADGNNVTIPVAIVTDEAGEVQTVPVATATDAKGSIVTIPVTTSATEPTEPATDNSGLVTGIVIVVIGAVVAVIVAVVAMKLRKKNEE